MAELLVRPGRTTPATNPSQTARGLISRRADGLNKVLNARRYFVGGSDAKIVMGDDEGAVLRLWKSRWLPWVTMGPASTAFGLRSITAATCVTGLAKRTPSPPPFSSMNSMPAASIARCSFAVIHPKPAGQIHLQVALRSEGIAQRAWQALTETSLEGHAQRGAVRSSS